MGYPVITRLGVNQFWYKHWYSDTSYSQNLKQDVLLEYLIHLYLKFGLTFQNNLFIHEYWYRKADKALRTNLFTQKNIKFFRRFFYENTTLTIEHSFFLRNETAEYFPLRTWILKYCNWLIICVHWFKPLKGKNTKMRHIRETSYKTSTLIPKNKNKLLVLRRLKLVSLFLNKAKNNVYKKYVF